MLLGEPGLDILAQRPPRLVGRVGIVTAALSFISQNYGALDDLSFLRRTQMITVMVGIDNGI